jgi:hypothetical protein
MKKRSESSFDDIYHHYSQFGLTPEEVDHYIDEYRRFGFTEEWIDEDRFYNLTANEDIPLDQALMIINCCIY